MLDEYMKNLGYQEEEMEFILSSYQLSKETESTLLYKIKSLVNYLHRNGLDNAAIINITTTIPNIIVESIENIKVRINELLGFGFNKLEVFKMIENYPYILEMSNQRINNKYQVFDEIGFSKDDCNELFVKKTDILNKDPSSIKKKIEFFLEYGYDKNDIITILREIPILFDMTQLQITKKLEEYKEFGFTEDEIIKITTYLPDLYIYNKEDITSKTKYLTENGYTTKNIINAIKKLPIILKHNNLSKIEENIENLENLGFGISEIVPLTEKNPYILLYSKDMISDNFKCCIKYNLFNNEVIKMMNETPLLLTYNKKELDKRLHYYKDKDLIDIIKNNSNYLLISLELIENREKYIKTKNKADVFLSDKEFYNKYKVNRDDILKGVK